MRGKFTLLLGLGAGYVLGAKAGRERYDQLRRLYDNLVSSPAVRQATGKAKDAVGSGLTQARGKVTGRSDDGAPGLSVAPPPS